MTRDDVIRMAREAGDDVEHTLPSDLDFERFAALVAAVERDALRTELADLRSSMTFRTSLIGRIEAERDALQAKVEAMERQKPVTAQSALAEAIIADMQAQHDSEPCMGLVSYRHPMIMPASALQPGEVGLTFVGHATFLIQSPGGVKVATDYNDYVRPSVTPDIATMNKIVAITTPMGKV